VYANGKPVDALRRAERQGSENHQAILNHFFCAIRAFTQLELMRAEDLIENWYEVQRNLSIQAAPYLRARTSKTENLLNAQN
jgi:hypothetical protein